MTNSKKKMTPRRCRRDPSDAKLEEVIKEAIVGARGESEQTLGFHTPPDGDQIAAVCSRRRAP